MAEVITHELSHQWFGNLVTMVWWDDLWLNEAFATWMAYKIVDQWRPQWRVWMDFEVAKGAALRFLPRYSPDFNPIEMLFSKLKTLLRRASERSIEALWNRIGELLDRFPQNECENYFKAAGYEPT